MEKKHTAVQQMISEFTDIQRNKCNTVQEVLFFDGVLAVIEAKYLSLEREQIEEAHQNGFHCGNDIAHSIKPECNSSKEYYTQTFKP